MNHFLNCKHEILIVLFIAAVEDTPVVGGSKCSWGPAYWCSTPEAAIECNVNVWTSWSQQAAMQNMI